MTTYSDEYTYIYFCYTPLGDGCTLAVVARPQCHEGSLHPVLAIPEDVARNLVSDACLVAQDVIEELVDLWT